MLRTLRSRRDRWSRAPSRLERKGVLGERRLAAMDAHGRTSLQLRFFAGPDVPGRPGNWKRTAMAARRQNCGLLRTFSSSTQKSVESQGDCSVTCGELGNSNLARERIQCLSRWAVRWNSPTACQMRRFGCLKYEGAGDDFVPLDYVWIWRIHTLCRMAALISLSVRA